MPKLVQSFGDVGQDREIDALWKALQQVAANTGSGAATVIIQQPPPAVIIPPSSQQTVTVENSDGTNAVVADTIEIDLSAGLECVATSNDVATITRTATATVPNSVSTSNSAGSSIQAANADHTHGLPTTAVTAGTYGDATHVGQFTVDAYGRLTAASNVAITPGADADIPNIALAFQPGGAAVGWAIPAAVTEFLGLTIHRGKYDLTNATSARIIVDVSSSAGVTNTIAAQYSTTGTTWAYMDGATGPSVGFAGSASGIQDGGWFTLAAGAKADVQLRFVGSNSGGGTINFGTIYLQVK